MSVQVRSDNRNNAFILKGLGQSVNDAIFTQDAGRAAPLLFGTVVSQTAANGQWVPMTSVAAIDGTSTPAGIFIGQDIPTADLVAGNVTNQVVLVGSGVSVAGSKVILENALTLADLITAVPWASTETIGSVLHMNGIDIEDTVAISGFENS